MLPSSPKKTVLIVENQPDQTELLERQFAHAGLRVVVTRTGEGALKKVMEHAPDLILLDVSLSDMDGLEFVSLIRANAQPPGIPILGMSIFPHMKSKCLARGCDDFLQKPVKPLDLMLHIKRFLR